MAGENRTLLFLTHVIRESQREGDMALAGAESVRRLPVFKHKCGLKLHRYLFCTQQMKEYISKQINAYAI